MEAHEWNERTPDGKRYYRATRHATRWTILTTLASDEDWEKLEIESLDPEILRALRDVVWRKYQRKRLPWERVAELDRLLGEEPDPKGRQS